MLTIVTKSADETINVGMQIGQLAQPGMVILLDGDLGAGKTTFTKGVARALGIKRYVKSPTFTLIREYPEGRIPLYHMDVYRLEDGGADDLGLEEYFDGDGLSIVEWSQYVAHLLPDDYLVIHFDKDAHNDNQRLLRSKAHGTRYQQLINAMEAQYHE